MSRYFITGTGTGVGKTFTTCALLHAMKAYRGYKPVISGYGPGENDTSRIASIRGGTTEEISPWRFAAPLSPDMAAAAESRRLELSELVEWTNALQGPAFIETVGGLMVPLNETHTTRDWMAACGLPLIMVTGTYLGALSHTLTTIEAAHTVGLRIAALVINESGESVGLEQTRASLKHHARIPLIIPQPRVASPKDATAIHALGEALWNESLKG